MSKLKSQTEDLTGIKFGRWTVLKFIEYRKCRGACWLCRCDCGTKKVLSGSSLKNGQSGSCGCRRIDRVRAKALPPGETAFRTLYNKYKKRAIDRGFIFGLTKEQFRELTKCNCHYCGASPNHFIQSKTSGYIYNGVDRWDNNLGYIESNVVPCCGMCNRMKMAFPPKDFINQVKRIANNVRL